jgi:hypothetical protein
MKYTYGSTEIKFSMPQLHTNKTALQSMERINKGIKKYLLENEEGFCIPQSI